jgi:hypothetical protein
MICKTKNIVQTNLQLIKPYNKMLKLRNGLEESCYLKISVFLAVNLHMI